MLIEQPIFKQSQTIACYLAVGSEFETKPIIEAIWKAGKDCYLPILTTEKSLVFVRYTSDVALQPNRYNIFEPKETSQQILTEKLDLVLMPLVAFDKKGNRLGAGGGYYDRTFKNNKTATLFGLGFAAQEVEEMESAEWDVKMDGVVTEEKMLFF